MEELEVKNMYPRKAIVDVERLICRAIADVLEPTKFKVKQHKIIYILNDYIGGSPYGHWVLVQDIQTGNVGYAQHRYITEYE